MLSVLRLVILTAFSASLLLQAEETGFMAKVRESDEKHYAEARIKAQQLLAEGRLDEANQCVLSVIPDEKLTPADCFVLGNLFFDLAPELSAKFHARAVKALPDDPHINLEWAMILHRQGKYQDAANSYRKCLVSLTDNYLPQALLADCLVRTGELADALKHWELAAHPRNHTGIDFAIYAIYGKTSPHHRHDVLLKTIKAGKLERLDELISLDAAWDRDWWNAETNLTSLDRDLQLASTLLGENSAEFAELKLYAQTYRENHLGKEGLKAELIGHKLILGADATLPKSGYVADRLIAQAIENKLVNASDIVTKFQAELLGRSEAKDERGEMALNTLATLLLEAKDPDSERLEKIDTLGWERHQGERFAASLLVSMLGRGDLKLSSPLLKKALDQFPESQPICMLELGLAMEGKTVQRDQITRAIRAEFRNLSNGMGGFKDSYRLKALFALLQQNMAIK